MSAVYGLERYYSVLRTIWVVWVLLFGTASGLALDEFSDLRFISRLPQSGLEVEAAFNGSRSEACELIPAGEPLEVRSFAMALTERDRIERTRRPVMASSRRDLFSVGLEFERQDRELLPTLSRSTIVDYLANNYVMIQARVRRDLLDRKLYFHHRPLAVTAKYSGLGLLTQRFEPLVADSIREFHSLGLFFPGSERLKTAEKLRTIVLIFRVPLLRPGSEVPCNSYEFVFIHGKQTLDERGELQLKPHVFVTTDERLQLDYLSTLERPRRPERCSILGRIAVTEFDSSGVFPKSSATRSYRLSSQQHFNLEHLDAYCRQQGLNGGIHENLSNVLDAIIDGVLSAD
jgi:hypothetical protein